MNVEADTIAKIEADDEIEDVLWPAETEEMPSPGRVDMSSYVS